ncbi:MAG TPA: hypothetical protein DF712_08805 [Balneola sp.]|jgi:2-polyprenyl-3-methyl-5-hydroxy-6-metoxy-1,4-benzoquinol methylase|nr:hypothetical protein [Balneola sp.]HCT52547.1 hypothetical protein [Balneola sp.]|tara:strand:- start:305 stop:1009 length:705 start_codon:yes stop_codon:yes gene_type:complete
MRVFLRHRKPELKEMMDDPNCDIEKLTNTFRQFKRINKLLSKWNTIYKKEIRPVLKNQNGTGSLLDIGFGGGDISIQLSELAAKDGFHLDITSIEADRRAFEHIQTQNTPSNIHFRHQLSSDLVKEKASFDFVISNHLLHHLHKKDFIDICNEAEQLASKKVIFNDIERNDIAYVLFTIFSNIMFKNSFISYDGRISIKRSYTLEELSSVAPEYWTVSRLFPFRLILIYDKEYI